MQPVSYYVSLALERIDATEVLLMFARRYGSIGLFKTIDWVIFEVYHLLLIQASIDHDMKKCAIWFVTSSFYVMVQQLNK